MNPLELTQRSDSAQPWKDQLISPYAIDVLLIDQATPIPRLFYPSLNFDRPADSGPARAGGPVVPRSLIFQIRLSGQSHTASDVPHERRRVQEELANTAAEGHAELVLPSTECATRIRSGRAR